MQWITAPWFVNRMFTILSTGMMAPGGPKRQNEPAGQTSMLRSASNTTPAAGRLGPAEASKKRLKLNLELHGAGSGTEAIERGGRILEVQDFGIVVVGGVHGLEFRIVLEHVDLGFTTVVADEFAREA